MADVVELYDPVAEERQLRLSARLDRQPIVHGDPDLLSQAVANLIDNALRYTPSGGEVTVALEGSLDAPLLTVSDRGIGIPEGESVFRRFYRLDSSRGSPGSGLGLSLVAAVARLHGIEVTLADNHPGLQVMLRWPA